MPTLFQTLEECTGLNSQSPESGTEPKGGQEDFFSVAHSSAVWEGTPPWRPQNTVVVCYLTGGQKFGENDDSNNVEIVNLPRRTVETEIKAVEHDW